MPHPKPYVRKLLSILGELGLGCIATAAAVITMISDTWAEAVLGQSVDGNSGTLEWSLVALLAAGSLAFGGHAILRWRRLRVIPTATWRGTLQ